MATDRFNYKRVTDPVHGAIGLSKLEIEVVSTQVFQRLRNVKQLGLAHYVFPGADYSRFSHSLGVCHVASRTLNALQQTGAISLEPRTIQLYRLAALLHDIGHYPFSHAMEEAIANHALSSPSLVEDGVAAAGGDISSTGTTSRRRIIGTRRSVRRFYAATVSCAAFSGQPAWIRIRSAASSRERPLVMKR